MNYILIKNINKFLPKKVLIRGWVFNIRSSGGIIFLQVRDGTGFIQAIIDKSEAGQKTFEKAASLNLETSLELEGLVKEEKRAPCGFEISAINLKIISKSFNNYPLGRKNHGPDFLLTNRHLWLRSKRQWAIQRVRNTIIYAIYQHLGKEDFIKIDAPILTPNACEGTTTLFPVPYLPAWQDKTTLEALQVNKTKNKEPYAFLSQSGQLYLEAAIFAHGKVFDFGPTFRAEKSKTRRHLTEFWMMDAEMAFFTRKENIKAQERLIVFIVKSVLEKRRFELQVLERDLEPLQTIVKGNFPVITHSEAIKILKKEGVEINERDDFGAEAETVLSKKFTKPLFVEKYPKEIKAFYMKEDPLDSTRVLNDDLLAPEGYGEIIGGSEREDNYDKLFSRLKELSYPISDYEWYLDLRKYGSVPHSGYGLGLERLVGWICKLDHVRETIPFPRMIERFNP